MKQEKRDYQTPELIIHGTVENITTAIPQTSGEDVPYGDASE